jgi:predicted ATPase
VETIPGNQTESSTNEYAKPPFIRRVRIQGYKSIAFCDVELQPLTILVGRNGSGKSNFLDALSFLRDFWETNITEAVRRHGGISGLVCKTNRKKKCLIEIETNATMTFGNQDGKVTYGIEMEFMPNDRIQITREWFEFRNAEEKVFSGLIGKPGLVEFLDNGKVISRTETSGFFENTGMIPTLIRMSGKAPEQFQKMAPLIFSMRCYNFNPQILRQMQKAEPGTILERDGRNLPATIKFLKSEDKNRFNRVKEYLSTIVSDVRSVDVVQYDEYETIKFQAETGKSGQSLEFSAVNMSDGTLRALASLAAAFQIIYPEGYPSIIGIEEPETALHPAAIRALVDALDEATQDTQIILTTHSPDLIRDPDIRPSQLLAVRKVDGETRISPIDPASRSAIEDHLYNAGELLQMDQLDIDEEDIERQRKEKYLGSEV